MSKMLVCPWLAAFRAGRVTLGLSMLAMQLSLVLWPMAVRLGNEFVQERRVQALLDQISVSYACRPYGSLSPVPVEADASIADAVI
ncbi:hypothetical protein [Acidocella aromatica]|uniref:Uncharacterized protein n=1 Tax=Acidocella aromatica TaxID=1303579 RepID=A0A840V7J5_9PROT|nr:hypothetical protein [Acidocella aromatica]MBB5371948.1 hypothetical protein [Acidocella aromatica]